jgi:hypothetical protein
MYTKEFIKDKLATDVRWMERALIVLFRRQTPDEQESDQTRVYNERGFNGVDSRYLSYCAKYILGGGRLSGEHVRKVGKKLPKYWRQIHDEIVSKGV